MHMGVCLVLSNVVVVVLLGLEMVVVFVVQGGKIGATIPPPHLPLRNLHP